MGGNLYVVGTPIGNLSDLSIRAKDTLALVDLIAAEDTRVTKVLLNYYNIKTSITSYHEKNEIYKAEKLIDDILLGKNIALVSDAGTPCISDPGYRLVNLARLKDIKTIIIPGPCAATSALSISGLPTDHFYFEGFLPLKKGRKTRFQMLERLPATIIIYESPLRVLRTLADIEKYWGDRIVSICREMTKIYEENFMGNISESISHFKKSKLKGEFVILVAKENYKITE